MRNSQWGKVKKTLFRLFLAVSIVFVTSCSGVGGGGLLPVNPVNIEGGGTSNPAEDTAGDEQSTETGFSSPGQVSLPAPRLEDTITASADLNAMAVSQASGGHPAGETLVITNEAQLAYYLQEQNLLGSVAMAQADDSICNEFGRVCVIINDAGGFEPTPLLYETGDDLSFAYLDTDSNRLGESATDTAIEAISFTGQEASALAKNNSGAIYQIDEVTDALGNPATRFIEMTFDGSAIKPASSNFDFGYEFGSVAGSMSALAFDGSNAALKGSGGIAAFGMTSACTSYPCDPTALGFDSNPGICDPESGCSTNSVKTKSGRIYFGTEYEVGNTSLARIRELYDDGSNRVDYFYGMGPPANPNFREYVDDVLVGNATSSFKATKVFDLKYDEVLGGAKDILVLFQDDDDDGDGDLTNNFKLLGRFSDSTTYCYNMLSCPALMREFNFAALDLKITQYQTEEDTDDCTHYNRWTDGSAAILTTGSIEFVSYDVINTTCEEDEFEEAPVNEGVHLTHLTANSLSIPGALGWSFNNNNTKAFVLTGTHIYTVNLGTKSITGTTEIKSIFGEGKDIVVTPKSILYHIEGDTEVVMVGTQEFELMLTFDVTPAAKL